MERWAALIGRHYRAILVASVLLAALSGLSLLRLRLDLDILDMLPRGAPAFDNFRHFVAEFGELDELLILLEGEPQELPVFADALGEKLRRLPMVEQVQVRIDREQVFEGVLGRYLFNYLPLDGYEELERRLTPEGLDAQMRRARAIVRAPFDLQGPRLVRRDPLGLIPLAARELEGAAGGVSYGGSGYLSTADGRALLVTMRPSGGAFDIDFSRSLMSAVRAASEDVRQQLGLENVTVGFTGSYAYAIEDESTIRADIHRYVVLALGVVLVIFLVGYGSLTILPFITWPLALSTLLSFAASVVFYSSLNAVSTSFAAILYGLSIDSGIHYYTRLLQERRAGAGTAAVARTLASLGAANFVASATTAAVFAIIGASALRGISQLGSLTGFGMMVNIVQFFVLYPALSFAMPESSSRVGGGATPRLGRLAAWCARRVRAVLGAGAVLLVISALLAAKVEFDSDLTRLRPLGSLAAQTQDRIASLFGSSSGTGAVLTSAVDLEAALRANEQVEQRLRQYLAAGRLQSVRGVAALLPSERTQRERLARFERLPRAELAIRVEEALRRAGFAPESFRGFLDRFRATDLPVIRYGDPALTPFGAAVSRLVHRGGGGFTVGTFIEPSAGVSLEDIERDLRRDLPQSAFIVTGRPILEAELGRVLRREAVWFFAGSFALNLLILLAQNRRLGFSLILLTPPAAVIVVFLALMQLTGRGIGPVNVIVIPLILGIGVDYCVYLGERFLEGGSIEQAATWGGRALCVSALTTMTGFGFLGLSNYPALSDLGWLTALSLFLCLIASVTVFPALLALLPVRRP